MGDEEGVGRGVDEVGRVEGEDGDGTRVDEGVAVMVEEGLDDILGVRTGERNEY